MKAMSRTVTTSLGVFNYVTDSEGKSWFLLRCACGETGTLTEDKLIQSCQCPAPPADVLWRELIVTMQVRRLDGEKPADELSNWPAIAKNSTEAAEVPKS